MKCWMRYGHFVETYTAAAFPYYHSPWAAKATPQDTLTLSTFYSALLLPVLASELMKRAVKRIFSEPLSTPT